MPPPLPAVQDYRYPGAILFAFLSLPCLLFYAFIAKLLLAAPLVVAMAAAWLFFRLHDNPGDPLSSKRRTTLNIACALAALVLTTLGGEGRLLPATTDWLIRDAVLHDLVARRWPFVYRLDDKDWLLRAPLGMYLVPALVGKFAGLYAAYLALWLQNGLALFAVLRVFAASARLARGLTIVLVFCIFSGWDVVGAVLLALSRMHQMGAPFSLPDDIGWWAGPFQYSSTMTLVYWVPNHALAGWFVTVLLLLWDRGQIRIGAVVMGTALAAFWSPFALMGALPFLIKAGIESFRQRRIRWADIGASLLLALALIPVALYLTADAAAVTRGFQHWRGDFAARYALFLAVEVLPFLVINRAFGDGYGGFSRSTYGVAVGSLVLMPLYKIGVDNDFVMRASIPALAILAITTGHTAYTAFSRSTPARAALVGIVLALGFLTGLDQTWHILAARDQGISRCGLIAAWDQDPISAPSKASYLADETRVPGFIRPVGPEIYRSESDAGRCIDRKL